MTDPCTNGVTHSLHKQLSMWQIPAQMVLNIIYTNSCRYGGSLHKWCYTFFTKMVLHILYTNGVTHSLHKWCYRFFTQIAVDMAGPYKWQTSAQMVLHILYTNSCRYGRSLYVADHCIWQIIIYGKKLYMADPYLW